MISPGLCPLQTDLSQIQFRQALNRYMCRGDTGSTDREHKNGCLLSFGWILKIFIEKDDREPNFEDCSKISSIKLGSRTDFSESGSWFFSKAFGH